MKVWNQQVLHLMILNATPRYEPLDMNGSLGERVTKEKADREKEKTKLHEQEFQPLINKKTKDDIKNRHTKKQQLNC